MPTIFLSPSVQEFNPYVIGNNEEYYMNLVADAMEPYLQATGIGYVRNDPDQSLSQVIAQSNAGNYDLHLALHSNAAGEGNSGNVRGTDVYYYTRSTKGHRAAVIIADWFKTIYPDPSKVKTVANSTLAELIRTRAPAVLIEIAYHDNVEDAIWIRDNIDLIARTLVQALAEYFGIPFIEPSVATMATVSARGDLLLRDRPDMSATVIAQIPDGEAVTVFARIQGWAAVEHRGVRGYAAEKHLLETFM